MNNREFKNAPYIHSKEIAINLHLDLLIGLLAVIITGVALNGLRVLVISLLSAASAWLTEEIGCFFFKRRSANDLRSIAIGLIIALICPVTVPIWLPALASAISVLFIRVILGPSFKNLFLTPVIGWLITLTIMPDVMTTFPAYRGLSTFPIYKNVGGFISTSSIAQILQTKQSLSYSTLELFTGNYAGPMGTTCIFVIFAVCIYFVFRKSMAWQVALSMIVTVGIFAVLFNRTEQSALLSVLYELTANSYIFIAVFVAGDVISAPTLTSARIIYGATIGTLTMIFRYIGMTEHSLVISLLVAYFFTEFIDLAALKFRIGSIKKIKDSTV